MIRSARRTAPMAALLAMAACETTLEQAGRPVTRPSGDEGMVVYLVGRLAFTAPAAWPAAGDPTRVRLDAPRGDARLEASAVQRSFENEKECLADAEAVLARAEAGFANVRRHPTTFAGRRAVTQEADQGPWHGWAWAFCDGPRQYRVWFAGLSPVSREAVDAQRILAASARLEGP
ncbi:MAG TPA: hypothetical protein VFR85_08895 [Anaeromyxobacteraceae bacterium]|nr:hypothetical protein [Anaeromyxobacteraceae bacterium]